MANNLPNVGQHSDNTVYRDLETAKTYADLAREWAISPDLVQNEDYSAKWWAQFAEDIINRGELGGEILQKVFVEVVPGMVVIPVPYEFTSIVVIIDGAVQSEPAGAYSIHPVGKSVTLSEPLLGNETVELWVNDIVLGPDSSNNEINIDSFGGVPNDSSIDNSGALLAAILAAGEEKTVVIYGGTYYFSNLSILTTCKISGGGVIAPGTRANLSIPLLEIAADNCIISNLTVDTESKGVPAILVTGNNNELISLTGRNFLGKPSSPTDSSFIRISGGNWNILSLIRVENYLTGTSDNELVPRMITVSGGGSNNSLFNISGNNIQVGVELGVGEGNSLMGFVFDNNNSPASLLNGLIFSEGSVGCSAQGGAMMNAYEPIISKGLNNSAKSVSLLDCGSLGVSDPCENMVFDSISSVLSDPTFRSQPFIKTTASNDNNRVDGVIVKNCTVENNVITVSFIEFESGAVDNLKVYDNSIITKYVDSGSIYRTIVSHQEGDNAQYSNNSFSIENLATPFTDPEYFNIKLPVVKSDGFWINNSLESKSPNTEIRVSNALNSSAFSVEHNNRLVADNGELFLQSGTIVRFLSGDAVPSSGVWEIGDTIHNSNIDLAPSAGNDFQKYQFFVCIKGGDYSDPIASNRPEFKLVGDMSADITQDQISAPVITSPADATQFNYPNIAIQSSAFDATGGITHASSDWEVATDSSFSNIVFSSYNDTGNLTSITALGLPIPSDLYVRVLHRGNSGETSSWSSTRYIITIAAAVTDDQIGKPGTFQSSTVTADPLADVFSTSDRSYVYTSSKAEMFVSTDTLNFSSIGNPSGQVGSTTFAIDGSDDGSIMLFSRTPDDHTNIKFSYYSVNNGSTWIPTSGYDVYQSTNADARCFLACDNTGMNVIIGTGLIGSSAPGWTLNRIYRSTDGGITISSMVVIPRTHGPLESCHVAKANPSYMFTCTRGSSTTPGGIYRSVNNGVTWVPATIQPPTLIDQVIFDVASDHSGQFVYCVARYGQFFKSSDFGNTWTQVGAGLSDASLRSVAVSSTGQMVAIGAQNGDYIRSFDFGATWSLTPGLGDNKLLGLDINSIDNLMYATSYNGTIYRSRSEDVFTVSTWL